MKQRGLDLPCHFQSAALADQPDHPDESTLLTGFLRREKHGIANTGFESLAAVILYFLAAILVLTVG